MNIWNRKRYEEEKRRFIQRRIHLALDVAVVDGEGCLVVFAVLAVSFIVGGLILPFGGAPMLLEAAFEAAFAGVVVRRPLSGDLVLGDWKICLLKNTWRQALAGIVLLVALAGWMQSEAPQASTFAQAIQHIVQSPKG